VENSFLFFFYMMVECCKNNFDAYNGDNREYNRKPRKGRKVVMNYFRKKENKNERNNDRSVILNANTPFHVKEAYKTLRTNIMFSLPEEGCKVIAVTSPLPNEGKSTTILNLAITFSQTGNRVLLIDGDMRRTNTKRMVPCDTDVGLSDILAHFVKLEDAIEQSEYENFSIIYSGNIPPNPAELLSGEYMRHIIEILKEQYDYIFIDMPPINVVTDAAVVSSLAHGVILVVRHNISHKDELKEAVNRMRFVNAKLLGVVLNDKKLQTKQSYMRYGKYNRYKNYYE